MAMPNDPGVQSVRVAAALCDRFEDLMKGPTKVTAAKRNAGLIGVSGNESELSLRIGEAQQIYPEIWRHLDEARAAFAARGIPMEAYDIVRAQEGNRLGANVQTSYSIVQGQYGSVSTTKDAGFNASGLQRARAALIALMQANPQVDWAGIARAEDNDPAVAAFRRATLIRRIGMFGALALVVAAPFLYVMWSHHQERVKREEWRRSNSASHPAMPSDEVLPAGEQAQLLERATKLAAAYAKATEAWPTATDQAALSALKAGAAPCTLPITAPPKDAADTYIRTNDLDAKTFQPTYYLGYMAGEGPLPQNAIAQESSIVANLEQRITGGHATAADRAELTDTPLWVALVLIDKNDEPDVTQTAPKIEYTPGHLEARGYIYSVEQARVVCAGTIDVTNTPAANNPAFLDGIRRAPDARKILKRELEIKLRDAIAALHAVP